MEWPSISSPFPGYQEDPVSSLLQAGVTTPGSGQWKWVDWEVGGSPQARRPGSLPSDVLLASLPLLTAGRKWLPDSSPEERHLSKPPGPREKRAAQKRAAS